MRIAAGPGAQSTASEDDGGAGDGAGLWAGHVDRDHGPRPDVPLVRDPDARARRRQLLPHQEEYLARDRRQREEEAQQNRRPWLDEIGLPRPLQEFTFATLDTTRPVEIVREFRGLVLRGGALVLLGPTGVGKTLAVVALIDSLLADFRTSMRYKLGLTLVRELYDFDERDETMARCARVRLLVLDDLPRVTDPRVAEMLEELLIVREAERRATIVTSNVAPKHLATLLSDRVIDRLKTWGSIQSVVGPSLRRAPEATS